MFLLVDTLSEPCYIALFDAERNIISEYTWEGKQKEFDSLVETIDAFVTRNNYAYKNLSGIAVVVGPGGFTGTRVTTLVVNTLGYSFDIPLFPLTVSDIFSLQNAPIPWITPVTKKEVLIWEDAESPYFKILPLIDLPAGTYTSITSIDLPTPNHTLNKVDNYKMVIERINLSTPSKRVKPLYAKDPNITLSPTPYA